MKPVGSEEPATWPFPGPAEFGAHFRTPEPSKWSHPSYLAAEGKRENLNGETTLVT